MTILSACQEAAIDLNQEEPSSLFSTSNQFAKEIRTQANRTAQAVAKAYDWQKLYAVHTLTGDGTATAFDLPADYDRMPKKTSLLTSSYGNSIRQATDSDQWLDFTINGVIGEPGNWIMLGGQINVRPEIATGETVKFYYIKNTMITGTADAAQATFVADTDTFDLPERLITLGVIWRWRAMKRMEYAEDMNNFEIAMAEEVASDKGSRVLTVGRQTFPYGTTTSYPRALG